MIEKGPPSPARRGGSSFRSRRYGRPGVLAAASLALAAGLAACGASSSPTVATNHREERAAPNGTFTLLDGTTATISSLRGSPTLVWVVADGCASCAASIPAVAKQFPAFTRAKTPILVLGLYGAFGQGSHGRAELASFGRAAAGPAFSERAWTWALASAGLTAAYDPQGVPDDYFLVDPTGRIAYRGSVPVSTMPTLLAHLSALTGLKLPARSPTPPPSTVPTLP